MKKQKLTPEEKAENRLIKKQWSEFIRRMKKKGALILPALAIFLLPACTSVKRYSYEATHLNEGEISKHHVKCQLVSVNRTMRGWNHVFVSANNDTLTRIYQTRFEPNRCYWVWKTRAEKNL